MPPKKTAEPAQPMRTPAHEAAAPETRVGNRAPDGTPIWKDERLHPPPPPRIPRADAVARLRDQGESLERAVQYVDLYHEYRTATLNIRTFGVICAEARSMNLMENPYLGRRDRARDALNKMRDIEAPWLWQELAE